jgi:hypothetical protein
MFGRILCHQLRRSQRLPYDVALHGLGGRAKRRKRWHELVGIGLVCLNTSVGEVYGKVGRPAMNAGLTCLVSLFSLTRFSIGNTEGSGSKKQIVAGIN